MSESKYEWKDADTAPKTGFFLAWSPDHPGQVREIAIKPLDGGRPLPYDRETLGRFVRGAWVRWAETQPNPKPSWTVPYDDLSEPDKEADRQIGEAVARWTLIGDAAALALEKSVASVPEGYALVPIEPTGDQYEAVWNLREIERSKTTIQPDWTWTCRQIYTRMLAAALSPSPSIPEEKGGAAESVIEAAKAVIAQWDTPNWKLQEPTANLIEKLRAAIVASPTEGQTVKEGEADE